MVHPVTILTDHKNLIYFKKPQCLSCHQARWQMFLQDYDLVWDHIQQMPFPGRIPLILLMTIPSRSSSPTFRLTCLTLPSPPKSPSLPPQTNSSSTLSQPLMPGPYPFPDQPRTIGTLTTGCFITNHASIFVNLPATYLS